MSAARGPRSQVPGAPVLLSQANAHLVGMSSRAFIARAKRSRHRRVGQLYLVEPHDFLESLPAPVESDAADEPGNDLDEARALVGRRRK